MPHQCHGKVWALICDLSSELSPQGSVLELDRSVGELMDVKINNTVIAKGEVVTVGDKLGISVVEIVAPLERVKPV